MESYIIKALDWGPCLEGCKHDVLVRFMDTEALSSQQVCGAQELSRYQVQIGSRQAKPMELLMPCHVFLGQRDNLQTGNTCIFHHLLTSMANASLLSLGLSDIFFKPDPSTPSAYLCNRHFPSATAVLEYVPIKAIKRRPLPKQH